MIRREYKPWESIHTLIYDEKSVYLYDIITLKYSNLLFSRIISNLFIILGLLLLYGSILLLSTTNNSNSI